ncbi:MAG: ATP-binding protein [Methanomassiliicoccaceae archaeon]|nr:ATP-binding protein [Methanomassiliicoccaceae archaeon]
MDSILRPEYFDRIVDFIGNPNAKVITGIRRCGKSTFMEQISQKISSDTDANVVYVDMELMANIDLKDTEKFYRHIKDRLIEGKKNVLFVDEVHEVTKWESVIRSLIAEKECDIYLTGSNSKLLSSEYATYLSGRIDTLEMQPLSFRECRTFNDAYCSQRNDEKLMWKYIEIGGFPLVWLREQSNMSAYRTLRDILNTVKTKDIVDRYGIKDRDLLERIFLFICSNLGNLTSLNNMYNILHAENGNVTRSTVYDYAGHLESSYLVYKAHVHEVKGKKLLSEKYKYFLPDIGLKHAALGYRFNDIAGHMENILFLDLKARGYDVWIGDNAGKEVDLVGEKFGERVYVQSVYRFSENAVKREFDNLKGIDDNHPKYVVTMDENMRGNTDGIICCGLDEFLKKDKL